MRIEEEIKNNKSHFYHVYFDFKERYSKFKVEVKYKDIDLSFGCVVDHVNLENFTKKNPVTSSIYKSDAWGPQTIYHQDNENDNPVKILANKVEEYLVQEGIENVHLLSFGTTQTDKKSIFKYGSIGCSIGMVLNRNNPSVFKDTLIKVIPIIKEKPKGLPGQIQNPFTGRWSWL
jgi:hypothetical protein